MSLPSGSISPIALPDGMNNSTHGTNERPSLEQEPDQSMPSPSIPTTGSNYDLSYYFQQPDAQNEEFPKVFYKRARSLSIGSVISTSQQQYIPQSDHTKSLKYKIKTNKSNQKAHQFFGEQIKLEITAKEIRREGLRALLLSTVPLGYFLYYLLNEYSSENLFFYLAVENYQNYEFSSHSERVHVATKISRAYLTRNSELEVNLEDKIYRTVQESLELLQQQEEENSYSTGTEFDAAKKHIFSLLNASYYRFRTTNVFNIMESKCSDMTSFNRERSQVLVINLLLSHMRCKNQSSTTYKLVNSFCRIYLPYGYSLYVTHQRANQPTPEEAEPRGRRKSASSNEAKRNNGFMKFDLFKLSRK